MSETAKRKRRNIFQGVQFKLTAIIVAVMAVPMILAVIISYASSYRNATKNMNAMNEAQIGLVEDDFHTIVIQNKTVLDTVANSVSAKKLIKGELDAESVAAWLGAVDEAVGDGNTTVISGADGMQICRANGECVDVSEREYFQICKKTKAFYASNQNISKTSGKRICTFICPILDDKGEFIGAVQRNYDLEKLTELAKQEVSEENQDIFIGDNNGDLIAHTTIDLETGEAVNYSTQQWYSESRSSNEASGAYNSRFNGTKWRISYQREPLTGWVTVVASDVKVSMKSSTRAITIIIIIAILMMIAAAGISVAFASSFTKPIKAVNNVIDGLAAGEFHMIEDRSLVNRKDEFGDIVYHINLLVEKLTGVVGDLQDAMRQLGESSNMLATSAGQISQTTENVSGAVQEIARGATDQADTVQRASDNIGILSDSIHEVANNAMSLAETAMDMSEQSNSSASAMGELDENMKAMSRAMEEISESMAATNGAVESVNRHVEGITSIASQTNLLALNASIEAARAGEAGSGFAVVADEIGKLAAESAETAKQINAEMSNLLDRSRDAIEKSEEVVRISENVNRVLQDTVNQINDFIIGVSSTVDGVSNISGLAQESAASQTIIGDAMDSLASISEENAASTEETAASMEELDATVTTLSQSAADLDELAKRLEETVSFFKL